jgi:WD40 repeat protein
VIDAAEATGRAKGFVAECPELATLQAAPLAPDIHDHVDVCESCQLVLELLATTSSDLDAPADCDQFEPLLAARADGGLGRAAANLLQRHLASCADCRAVADTMVPAADATGDHASLPRVTPESYALGLEVARGGMGRIIAARDLRVGRSVAVKECRSRQLAARFEREARITARLQHPGIVTIYEIGRWPDGTPFYSMRWVEGRTLREAIATATTLAARLAMLPAVIAAIDAVAFAHAQRIIHRDLTPSNVLVGAYGETVVIDWGLAKDVSEADEPGRPDRTEASTSGELTNIGAVIGTAAYMPPEQANAGAVDERADVYALGAILYHLLAGDPPYRAKPGIDVIAAVKAGPPPSIDAVAPTAPRDLRSIVVKAMAREPADRYPSARELAEELTRFQTGRMVEAHAYTTAERMRRFITRNRAPLLVTGLAVLALGVLGALAVRGVIRERAVAEREVLALLEEDGRGELLAGDSQRALAYFDTAYAGGRTPSRALQFMRAAALRDITTVVGDLECGGDVRDLAFSPDHELLVASCRDRAKAWRLSDRTVAATYQEANVTDGFDHLEYTHDGSRLVTYGGDGVARLWDAATGTLIRTFTHEPGSTISFATFTPKDDRLATTGYDGWWRIWDVKTGTLVRAQQASNDLFHHVYGVLNSDGTRLFTFTFGGHAAGWDIETGAKIGSVEHGSYAAGGSLSPAKDLAATCGANRLVKLWDTTSPRMVIQLAGATDTVFACRFSSDGSRVIGTSQDGHAYVWNVRDGAMVASANHGTPVWTGHFSPDGTRFTTVGRDGTVKVWDTETGGLLAAHDTRGGHEAVFSPGNGAYLIAARGDGRIRIWLDPAGPLLATLPVDEVLATTKDGSRYITQRGDGRIVLRDTATHTDLPTPPLAPPIATTTDYVTAVTAGDHVAVIAARTGAVVRELAVGAAPRDLALSSDGQRVVVMFDRRPPEVWDFDGTMLVRLAGAHRAIVDATGARALAWDLGGRPRLWDVDTRTRGVELATTPEFQPVGFAGNRVVVYEPKGHEVTIWNLAGDHEVITEVARTPTLDPTARYLTAIFADSSVKIRDLGDSDRVVAAIENAPLLHAEADPSAELVAGIDSRGASVVVLNARDGRVLAQWPIAHDSLVLRENDLIEPFATASWSRDGTTIVSRSSRQIARWNTDTAVYDEAGRRRTDVELAGLVRAKVPWRVVGAQLVRSTTFLRCVIRQHGIPLANQTLTLVFRKPPNASGAATSWDAAAFTNTPFTLTTDAGGEVMRAGLQPGTYKIVVGKDQYLLDVDVDDGADRAIELDRLARP